MVWGTRSLVVAGAIAGAFTFAFACSTGPSDPRPLPDGGGRPDDVTAAAARAACRFQRGAMPADTLGTSARLGKDIPIDTIVVLMQENRSFDEYFSHLGRYAHRSDIESAPDNATNPHTLGGAAPLHTFHHAPHQCVLDPNHEWQGTHLQYADGRMDGFFATSEGWSLDTIPDGGSPTLATGDRAMEWFDERDIPFYYQLASTFAIGDRYHSSIPGPTWPNRMYLYAGTSWGQTENEWPDLTDSPFPDKDIILFDLLEKAGISWNIVSTSGLAGAAVALNLAVVNRWGARNPVVHPDDFVRMAREGTLPQVLFVDPDLGNAAPSHNDEHPPGDAQIGQEFVSDIVHALFTSPQWPRLALFFTYDEHGGFYDHVPPPPACAPDSIAPVIRPGNETDGGFDRYGIRVPFVVVSPYAKAAYVSHVLYDHTSILRFIEARFGLPALTARDANAAVPYDLFDFSAPSFAVPPTIPEPVVDQAELEYCELTYRR